LQIIPPINCLKEVSIVLLLSSYNSLNFMKRILNECERIADILKRSHMYKTYRYRWSINCWHFAYDETGDTNSSHSAFFILHSFQTRWKKNICSRFARWWCLSARWALFFFGCGNLHSMRLMWCRAALWTLSVEIVSRSSRRVQTLINGTRIFT